VASWNVLGDSECVEKSQKEYAHHSFEKKLIDYKEKTRVRDQKVGVRHLSKNSLETERAAPEDYEVGPKKRTHGDPRGETDGVGEGETVQSFLAKGQEIGKTSLNGSQLEWGYWFCLAACEKAGVPKKPSIIRWRTC